MPIRAWNNSSGNAPTSGGGIRAWGAGDLAESKARQAAPAVQAQPKRPSPQDIIGGTTGWGEAADYLRQYGYDPSQYDKDLKKKFQQKQPNLLDKLSGIVNNATKNPIVKGLALTNPITAPAVAASQSYSTGKGLVQHPADTIGGFIATATQPFTGAPKYTAAPSTKDIGPNGQLTPEFLKSRGLTQQQFAPKTGKEKLADAVQGVVALDAMRSGFGGKNLGVQTVAQGAGGAASNLASTYASGERRPEELKKAAITGGATAAAFTLGGHAAGSALKSIKGKNATPAEPGGYTRLISQREKDALDSTGKLPGNYDNRINVIAPGKESSIIKIPESKKYKVTFSEDITKAKGFEMSGGVQGSVRGGIDKKYISSVEPRTSAPQVGKTTKPISETPKPIAQDIPYEKAVVKDAPTSRVKQYDASLKETIKNIEASPAYKKELASRGGGKEISNAKTYKSAEKLGLLPDEHIINAKPQEAVDSITLVRAKATVDTAAKELVDAVKTGDSTKITAALERSNKLTAGYHIMSGEAGRSLQIQSSFVTEATDLAKQIREYTKTTGGKLTEGQKEYINKKLVELETKQAKLDKGTPLSATRSLLDMVTEYSTAAKLTSPLTHAVNTVSNALTFAQRGVEKLVSTTAGAAKGETSLGELKYTFGTVSGWSDAMKTFGTDMASIIKAKPVEHLGKIAREGIDGKIPGKAGEIIRTPFKFLEAADNFSKTILRNSEGHARAYEMAYQEGARGKALATRIGEILDNPPQQILDQMEKVAKEYTFQADPGPAVKKISELVNTIPGGRLIVPFIQTPTNIVKFYTNRSVLGLASPKNWSDMLEGGLAAKEAGARIFTGTIYSVGAYTAVSGAMSRGGITGAAPNEPGARDLFYAQGKKPYSIKIGDRWVSYQRFQPAGLYILQAVALKQALDNRANKESIGDTFGALAATAAKGLSDLPFVQGVNSLIEAINDPETKGKAFIRQLATGSIPNIGRDVSNYLDNVNRYPQNLQDSIRQMIPGQSKKLEPRIDVLGNTQTGDPNNFVRGFVKIAPKGKENDLLKALEDIGKETGYYPSVPKRTQRDKNLSSQEYVKFEQRAGELTAQKLSDVLGRLQSMPADQKKKELSGIVDDARSKALDEMFGKPEKKKSYKRQLR